MIDPAEALFTNEAFYLAFRERDIDAMDLLWARHAQVACIHPGWSALTDRQSVIESWAAILGNPDSPQIFCRGANAFMLPGSVFVLCYETMKSSILVATNIYIKEEGETRLVHHQAGQSMAPPEGLPDDQDQGPLQ